MVTPGDLNGRIRRQREYIAQYQVGPRGEQTWCICFNNTDITVRKECGSDLLHRYHHMLDIFSGTGGNPEESGMGFFSTAKHMNWFLKIRFV